MAKKIIRAKQTYAGSDGTGYFRGENGKYYYGNAQNGYVTKTLDQQRRDADEAAIQAQTDREQADIQSQIESYHAMRYARDHSPEARQARAAVTFAAGVSLGAFLAPVFYIFACLLVMSSLQDTWPTLLEELFFQYASGRADAATVLHTVNALAVMALFVWNLRGAWAGRQRTRWFAVPAVLLTSALYMAAETIGGPFYPLHLIFHTAYAMQLASLPALILYYVGFRRSGGRQFLRGIAQRLWDLMPGHGATFRVIGGLTCGLVGLGVLVSLSGGTLLQDLVSIAVILLFGIFAFYTARVGEE